MPFGVNPITGRPGPAPFPSRDGDKVQARQHINRQVKTGVRPHPRALPCTDCGHIWRKKGDRRHEYDHHLGYGAKHHDEVEPICTKCHAKRDSAKANQTHCSRGHEFTPENTYRKKNGTRTCRQCMRIWDRARTPRGSEFWRDVNIKRGRTHG